MPTSRQLPAVAGTRGKRAMVAATPSRGASRAEYRLSGSLPYLLNRVGVLQGELFGRELAPYGVTVPMYRVVAALTEASGQRLGDLSAATSIELTTLSRLIGQMVTLRLVVRTRPDDNARTVQIRLTAKGHELAEELIPKAIRYESEALSVCTAAEVDVLRRALTKIYARLVSLEGPRKADGVAAD